MQKRSRALLISITLLGLLGLQGAFGIPAAFVARDIGQFTTAVQIGSGVGAILWTLVWCGLAYVQWARRGAWGRRISILALVVLGVQSWLFSLAISSGRVPPSGLIVARFVVFTLVTFVALGASSFVSNVEYRKKG